MIKNLLFSTGITLSGFLQMSAQCTAVDSFSENFDAYTAPLSIVPTCWDRITQNNASQIISSTQPASGTGQIYQFGYGNGVVSIVIMPELTNINAGTHHFRFKAKANSGPGLLQFGYITDINNASTFVTLESVTISNSSYDSTSERILDVPTTVPADARLAIRNPGTTWAGHYWDDAIWEPKTNLGTKEQNALSEVKIYPNPFHNTISLSETKNVEKITITDAVGRLVKTFENPKPELPAEDLGPGVYFMTLHYKNGTRIALKAIKN